MFNLRIYIHRLLSVGLLLSLLLNARFASADQWSDWLQQRMEIQSAEIKVIEARLELDEWNHKRLAGLYQQGFASWLELRRHQLQVDSITVRRDIAASFQSLLCQVQDEKLSRVDSSTLIYRQRDVTPVKLFMPDSVRLIGWIEGQAVAGTDDLSTQRSAVDAAHARLEKAQRRFDETAKIQLCPVAWREKASLDLSLAKNEFRFVTLLVDFEKTTPGAAEMPARATGNLENFVTTGDDAQLDLATERLVAVEKSAVGRIRYMTKLLQREQKRAEATRRLRAQGYASNTDLNMVNDRVASLRAELTELTEASRVLDEPTLHPAGIVYNSPGSWPDVVFNDEEFAKHLIDLRHQFYDETYRIEIARLKSGMLRELEQRLANAAADHRSETGGDQFLHEGQENEIERNRLEIELTEANVFASSEKQQIFVLEENRFIQQIIVQHAKAAKQTAIARSGFSGPQSLLSSALPAGLVFSNGTSKPAARYSFLEPIDLDPPEQSGDPVAYRFGHPFLAFSAISPINRITLEPAKPVLLGNSNRRYVDTRGLQVGSNATDRLRWSPRQRASNSLPLLDPNVTTVNYYGRYGYRSYGTHSAYPNGILRSELRNVPPVGQTPFYLPGWPDNVRVDGYRFGHPDRLYRQWYPSQAGPVGPFRFE